MTIKKDLLGLVERVNECCELPPVGRVYIPEPDPGPDKNTEFGVIALQDGSAGLYYAWLGTSQQGMRERFPALNVTGSSPMTLVPYFTSADEAECSVGMAVINAVSQNVFHRAGYVPDAAVDSLGSLDIRNGDHIGMVGYFPSLVRRLRELGSRVTVIERKEKFIGTDGGITIVPDPERLRGCNKIVSTASTLLNNTIDGILEYTRDAESISIIGPTAGFFPDPLFARGVTAVGGTQILDADAAIDRFERNEKPGPSARKYIIHRDTYPGVDHLLEKIRQN